MNPTGKAVPDEVKRRRGTDQPSRMNPGQPVYGNDTIREPPRHLDRKQKALWRKIVRMMLAAGVGQNVDEHALTVYVTLWTMWAKEAPKLETEGGVLTDQNGKSYTNPRHRVVIGIAKELRALWTEFGFTPVTRQRIEGSPPPKEGERFSGVNRK